MKKKVLWVDKREKNRKKRTMDAEVAGYTDEELLRMMGLSVYATERDVRARLEWLLGHYERAGAEREWDFFAEVERRFFEESGVRGYGVDPTGATAQAGRAGSRREMEGFTAEERGEEEEENEGAAESDVDGESSEDGEENSYSGLVDGASVMTDTLDGMLKVANSFFGDGRVREGWLDEGGEDWGGEGEAMGGGRGKKVVREGFVSGGKSTSLGKNEGALASQSGVKVASPAVWGNSESSTKKKDGASPSVSNLAEDKVTGNVTISTKTAAFELDAMKLNPFLKQTLTSLVTIDSQYRDALYTMSTDFAFELSRPLRDVVSMKLYSIQLPYTWWTVNSAFGSNFFYLKGVSSGVDTGEFDYKVWVSPGNYTASTLVTAINASFRTNVVAANPDTDFGTQDLVVYDSTTTKATVQVQLDRYYNETDYKLVFPATEYRGNFFSIPSFFGMDGGDGDTLDVTEVSYTCMSVWSEGGVGEVYSTDNVNVFWVGSTNNYFTILQYTTTPPATTSELYDASLTEYSEYQEGISTVHAQYVVRLTLPVNNYYSRTAIYLNLQTVLQSHEKLDTSKSGIWQRVREDGRLYFEMRLKLNRATTANHLPRSKLLVEFPDETSLSAGSPVWTGGSSVSTCALCFLSEVESGDTAEARSTRRLEVGRLTSTVATYVTTISLQSSLSFTLECTKAGWDIPANTLTATISAASDLLLDEYFAQFNAGLSAASAAAVNSANPSGVLNMGNTGFVYDTATNGSRLDVDLNRRFSRESMVMVADGTFLQTDFHWWSGEVDLALAADGGAVSDVNGYIWGWSYGKSYYSLTEENNGIIIRGKSGTGAAAMEDMVVKVPAKTYSSYLSLGQAVVDTFNTYVDSDGDAVFYGTICKVFRLTVTSQDMVDAGVFGVSKVGDAVYFLGIKLVVNKVLTESDYKVKFYDGTAALTARASYDAALVAAGSDEAAQSAAYVSYVSGLDEATRVFLLELGLEAEYSLKDYSTQLSPGSWVSRLPLALPSNVTLFTITDGNDHFRLDPVTSGVTGSGSFVFTLAHGTYSNLELVAAMNAVMSQHAECVGTTFSLDVSTLMFTARVYVEKRYTASDYKLVFYDRDSFVSCNIGVANTNNATWDTTLGWILGFQKDISFDLNLGEDGGVSSGSKHADYVTSTVVSGTTTTYTLYSGGVMTSTYDSSTGMVTWSGDTVVSTNLVTYVTVTIDDYTASHMNNTMVTLSGRDLTQRPRSYADFYYCAASTASDADPVNPVTHNRLTMRQAYAVEQARVTEEENKLYSSLYTSGPTSSNIFAMVPLKLTGLSPGQTYVEFGGTLQNNTREYFGPVNLSRMRVRLYTDKGALLDLNSANFTITILVESMYNSSMTTAMGKVGK